MRSFLAALQFLTIIPIRMQLQEESFARAPFWFPCAGLVIGGITVFFDSLLARLGFSLLLQSILTVGLLSALSGGLHLDGLADTADGFLSARPKERVLEIMRDSRIGTMGALTLFFVLSIKVVALSELFGTVRWHALLLTPLAGRSTQLALLNLMPYARRDGGLASCFLRHRHPALTIWALLWIGGASVLLFGLAEGVGITILIGLAAFLLGLWSRNRIGGFTGDTLGATSELVETTVLIVAAVNA